MRIRCGFSNYFDPKVWASHAITERWTGVRWVRDDPQVDALQTALFRLNFDPHDQPSGQFLTGTESWRAARAGAVDPELFGNGDDQGLAFIAAAAHNDVAHVNRDEVTPWERGLPGPRDPLTDERAETLDEVALLVDTGNFDAMRERYVNDARLRLPAPTRGHDS